MTAVSGEPEQATNPARKSFLGALAMFGQRKMAAMLLLGFSSGLPFLLTRDTLQAWLSVEGIDLATLGFVSLISFPYTWKWLWGQPLAR